MAHELSIARHGPMHTQATGAVLGKSLATPPGSGKKTWTGTWETWETGPANLRGKSNECEECDECNVPAPIGLLGGKCRTSRMRKDFHGNSSKLPP